MKKFLCFLSLAMVIAWFTVSDAGAMNYRFTATSDASGPLGYLEYNSNLFSGPDEIFIDNGNLLNINFIEPSSMYTINNINTGADDDGNAYGVYFDVTGSLPRLTDAFGWIGGSSYEDGAWISGPDYISLGTGSCSVDFYDVTWTTQQVPEPATMLLLGSSLLGFAGFRRRLKK